MINRLIQKGKVFNAPFIFNEFNEDWDMYDFVDVWVPSEAGSNDYNDTFIYAKKNDGSIWVCGQNNYGQLGLGDTIHRTSFTKLEIDNVKDILIAGGSAIIIKNDGSLWACGRNDSGQLGLGDTTNKSVFKSINMNMRDIDKIHLSSTSMSILKKDKTIWCCGLNFGQIVNNSTQSSHHTLVQVEIDNAKNVYFGDDNIYVLKDDSTVWVRGLNTSGQLGLGDETNKTSFTKLNLVDIVNVYPLKFGAYFVKSDQTIWGTGLNTAGQLGVGDSVNKKVPTLIPNLTNSAIKDIYSPSAYNTLIEKIDGTILACGYNNYGQLGLGDKEVSKNSFIEYPHLENIRDFKGSSKTNFIRYSDDTVKFAGKLSQLFGMYNYYNIEDTSIFLPYKDANIFKYSKIKNLNGKNILINNDNTFAYLNDNYKIVASNSSQSIFILKNDGTVWSCGLNSNGQLGLGNTSFRSKFTKVDIDNVKDIICGANHTFIIKNDGTVWATGYNYYGQLGLGNENSVTTFTKVDIDNVKEVICGGYHTFIIKNDGTVWSCGWNDYYQTGLGNVGNLVSTFTKVDIDNVKYITCGNKHTFIIKNDGTAWSCGRNVEGQLGLGDNNKKIIFTKLKVYNIREIICGGNHTFIIKENNTLWSCGQNNYGQLGLGNTVDRNSFINTGIISFNKINSCIDMQNFILINNEMLMVKNDTLDYKKLIKASQNTYNFNDKILLPKSNIKEFFLSKTHSFIIDRENNIFGCGSNKFGQLCLDINTTEVTDFTELPISDIRSIASGNDFSYFVKNDGTLYSAGRNDSYQLGLGNNDLLYGLQRVPQMSNCDKVYCGDDFTLVLKNDKSVWAQGKNRAGIFGLGKDVVNNYYRTFVKIAVDVEEIKINDYSIELTKTDKSLWISGRIGSTWTKSTDSAIFNKVEIPEKFNNKLISVCLSNNDKTVNMIYMYDGIDSPRLDVVQKSIGGVTLQITDPKNSINKVEMYVNNKLSSSKNISSNTVIFEIPLLELLLGQNNIHFKTYSTLGGHLYAGVIVEKNENSTININTNNSLFIGNKLYRIESMNEDNGIITMVLDRGLESEFNAGDIVYQQLNKIAVQIRTNNSGTFKNLTLVSTEKNAEGYREVYELVENDITSIDTKVIVVEGNENTAIKKPAMLFKFNDEI